MGATILDGRDFSERDVAGAPRVAIVNESLARRLWPGERAVGQRLTLPRAAQELEVVGVAADFAKTTGGDAVEPEVYWPFLQQPRWAFHLVFRTRGTDDSSAALRARLSAIDPDLVPTRIETMSDLRARATKGERFGAFLLGMFATTALLIAALGTYGLASYSAAQRTREFGIRISFGASPSDITRLVLRTGIIPVVAGVIAGLAGAIAATRVLAWLVPAAAAPDLAAFSVAAALLLGVAVAACLIPARGALRVDAMAVLGAD
jgi:putative ABC transport system permease protein